MSHGHLRRTLDRTTVLLAVTFSAQVAIGGAALIPESGLRAGWTHSSPRRCADRKCRASPSASSEPARSFSPGVMARRMSSSACPSREKPFFNRGRWASQFTAVAVMLEVEDGKLGLDDPDREVLTRCAFRLGSNHHPQPADAHFRRRELLVERCQPPQRLLRGMSC